MKYVKTIIFLIIFTLFSILFFVEIAPDIQRINENNKKIEENNKKLREDMNSSFKNYESVYNEDTNSRYWNDVP